MCRVHSGAPAHCQVHLTRALLQAQPAHNGGVDAQLRQLATRLIRADHQPYHSKEAFGWGSRDAPRSAVTETRLPQIGRGPSLSSHGSSLSSSLLPAPCSLLRPRELAIASLPATDAAPHMAPPATHGCIDDAHALEEAPYGGLSPQRAAR